MLHEVVFFRENMLEANDICYLKNNKKEDRYFKKISEDEVVEINRIYPYDYTSGKFKENDSNIKIIHKDKLPKQYEVSLNEFHYIETNKKYKLEKICVQSDVTDLIDFENEKLCYFIKI
ncbi:hypothetical protein [Cetobacterium somerae]